MAIVLVVETGAGLPNSNTYATVEQLTDYAAARGISLPNADKLPVLLTLAMDYLEQYDYQINVRGKTKYQGRKASATQALLWPRTGVVIDEAPFPSTSIPRQLVNAQLQLAIEAIDFDLMPSSEGYSVAKEKVGPLEVEYAAGGRLSGTTVDKPPRFPKVEALLAPLFSSLGYVLRSVRI